MLAAGFHPVPESFGRAAGRSNPRMVARSMGVRLKMAVRAHRPAKEKPLRRERLERLVVTAGVPDEACSAP
ncbi:hypothetical protein PTE30175_02899 [Pandoraea terrae]|uniref:Uncharacterized protein n=1 Tax=Pandoraea terrae TaxID=1537710 RepID=A0A5E4W358_9BURK|nr:hypothetical protein PTE30175_02899 [Pandoraea terrae]